MRNKETRPTNEEIGQRARDLARQASGRLFVSQDGLYLVRGMPKFEKLRLCLGDISGPPLASEAPTPLELGFTPKQISPLSAEQLTAWGRGLQKWRKILDSHDKSGQKASNRRKHQHWKGEVEALSHTLEHLWETLRLWEDGKPIQGQPYPHKNANAVGSGECESKKIRNIDPLWEWHEELVAWLAGPKARLRFRESLRPYWERTTDDDLNCVTKALERVIAIGRMGRRRVECGDDISDDLAEAISAIPKDIKKDFRIRLDSDTPIRILIEDLEAILSTSLMPTTRQLGSAAALCAFDRENIPIPFWFLSPCAREAHYARIQWFRALYCEHGKAGYDQLLMLISDNQQIPWHRYDPERAASATRQFLRAGINQIDIFWALENLEESCIDLAEKGLSPRPFRLLADILERAGLDTSHLSPFNSALRGIVRKVSGGTGKAVVEAFAVWLNALDPRALDAGIAKWAWFTLCDLVVLEGASPTVRNRLMEWADPPVAEEKNDSPVVNVSDDIAIWASRLGYYQQMCGKQQRLPRSVNKMLEVEDRETHELRHLRKAREAGELKNGMADRLELLESREQVSQPVPERRILKKIQEACAHCALEAVGQLANDEGRHLWKALISLELPQHLEEAQILTIVAWATCLDEISLGCLHELVKAWEQSGQAYRKNLSLNLPWTKVAADRIDLDGWLFPNPVDIIIDGRTVQVGIADDPFRTLLMGTYFGTCLSLDGLNNKAVLANTYDANKNVVFVLDSNGQVLARKLVCITADFKLIGYRTYIAKNESLSEEMRTRIFRLVDAFCGHWANHAGLELAYSGPLGKTSGLFWYDDGVHLWSQIAKVTWSNPSIPLDASILSGTELMPRVLAALEIHKESCIELLLELGVWPIQDCEGRLDLKDFPALAEESLAILARDQKDIELAKLLRESSITYGGWLEAIVSSAILEDSDDVYAELYGLRREGGIFLQVAIDVLNMKQTDLACSWVKRSIREYRYSESFQISLVMGHACYSVSDIIGGLFEADFYDHVDVNGILASKELCHLFGKVVPERMIRSILTESIDGSRQRFHLAQWLSVESRNMQWPTIKVLQEPEKESVRQYAEMSAIIFAMQKPSAQSINYLKQLSARNPSALLALALVPESNKYRKFIREGVLKFPNKSASMLAHLLIEGEAALDDWSSSQGCKSEYREKAHVVRQLKEDFERLNITQRAVRFSRFDKCDDPLPLIPYILHWLWHWLDYDEPNVKALCALVNSDGCVQMLKRHEVNFYGLAFRLGLLLGRSEGEDDDMLGETLLQLRHKEALEDDTDVFDRIEMHLVLQKLSRGKFFAYLLNADHPVFPKSGQLIFTGIWDLLLDEEGEPLEVLDQLVDILRCYEIRLPVSPRAAVRVVKWLERIAVREGDDEIFGFVDRENLVESIKPVTDIQKQMVKRYIATANE